MVSKSAQMALRIGERMGELGRALVSSSSCNFKNPILPSIGRVGWHNIICEIDS